MSKKEDEKVENVEKEVRFVFTQEKNAACYVEKNGKKIGIQSCHVSAGHTMNLGEYNSAKVDTGFTLLLRL